MKKIFILMISFIGVCALFVGLFIDSKSLNTANAETYLRVHIRAMSAAQPRKPYT